MARPATLLAESSREEKYEARGSVLLRGAVARERPPDRRSAHRRWTDAAQIVPLVEIEVGIDEIFAGCVNGPVCLNSAIDLFYLE